MKTFALVAAVAVFLAIRYAGQQWAARAEREIDNPSPTAGEGFTGWVKRLLGKGSDPEPDDDPPADRRGYRLIDEGAYTRVVWGRDEDDPTLDEYVADLMDRGWRAVEIIDDTMRRYRVSESTVKRARRRIRAQA